MKERIEIRERLGRRNKVKEEEHLRDIRGLREEIGMKTHLQGPMDYAKTLKLQFQVEDLDLPERRKRYTSSQEEEEDDTQLCSCGKAIEGKTLIVEKCELYKEEREVLKEMRKTDK